MARFHGETKKKKQFEVCDKQTDRQSQLLTIVTPGLGAEINRLIFIQKSVLAACKIYDQWNALGLYVCVMMFELLYNITLFLYIGWYHCVVI